MTRSPIASYARPRGGRASLLAAAGLWLAPGLALADTAAADVDAAGNPQVTVTAAPRPLSGDTGIATLPGSVQDTPQAVQVIGAEQLRTQGVSSLEQALRNVPGITIAIGEGGTLSGDQFKIRGFDAKDDVYVDGLRDFGAYTRDSFDAEEVEVLKGPSGAMFGRGTTGGVINTVSKSPQLKDFATADGYVGNGDYYRGLIDINRQLGPTTAFRLNLMGTDAGVVDRDVVHSRRWGFAAALGLGLGTKTALTINLLHQQDHRIPDYGVVIGQPTGSLVALPLTEYGLRQSTYTGFTTDRDATQADVLTIRLKSELTPSVTLTSDSRLGVYSRFFQYTTTDGCFTDPVTHQTCADALLDGNAATIPIGTIGGSGPYRMKAWGAQNITTLRFDQPLGTFRNQFIAGLDISYQNNRKTFFAYTLPQTILGGYLGGKIARTNIPVNLLADNGAPPPGYTVFLPTAANIVCTPPATVCSTALSTTTVYSTGEASDFGGFITDRFWLAKDWSVIGSLRYDRYDAKFTTIAVSGLATPIDAPSTLFDPRVSLVYEPNASTTFYLSWGRSATPQGASVVGAATAIALTAKDLAPEISRAWEAGAKVGVLGGRLSLTGSVFDVIKDNATQTDPSTGFLIAQSGEQDEVKGVELGATGKLTRDWSLSANYTHLDARVRQAFVNCVVPTSTVGTPTTVVCPVGVTAAIPVLDTVSVGRQVIFVPKDAASFWTTYDIHEGAARGVSLGGGVTYQSKLFVRYTGASASYADRSTLVPIKIAEVPSSLSVDGYVAYSFDRYRVALNVYNLANRLNYTQVFGTRAIPVGRSFIVSLGASF